jgi:hypothetical protein
MHSSKQERASTRWRLKVKYSMCTTSGVEVASRGATAPLLLERLRPVVAGSADDLANMLLQLNILQVAA